MNGELAGLAYLARRDATLAVWVAPHRPFKINVCGITLQIHHLVVGPMPPPRIAAGFDNVPRIFCMSHCSQVPLWGNAIRRSERSENVADLTIQLGDLRYDFSNLLCKATEYTFGQQEMCIELTCDVFKL